MSKQIKEYLQIVIVWSIIGLIIGAFIDKPLIGLLSIWITIGINLFLCRGQSEGW